MFYVQIGLPGKYKGIPDYVDMLKRKIWAGKKHSGVDESPWEKCTKGKGKNVSN